MSADFWFQEQGGGPNPGLIGNSLRFRGSQYLTRTNVSNPTSTKTCTVSLWCKYALTNSTNNTLVSGESGLYTQLNFGGSNGFYTSLATQTAQGASVAGRWQQRGENRDPSAWMHVVMVYNSVSGGSNGIRVFKNGVELPNAAYTDPNGTDQFLTKASTKMQVGAFQNTYLFQGYMAEVYLIDGQALDPTHFGEYDSDGVWVPIHYTGTYGNSGYYLDFSDPNNIGADRSGNGNNFTPTGFELTNADSTNYDWMDDSPTKNGYTWNPVSFTAKKTYGDANRELSVAGQQSAWSLTESQISLNKPTGRQVIELAFAAYYSTSYNKATGINIRSGGSNNIFAYWQAALAAGNRNRVTFLDNSLAVTTTWPTPGGTNTGQGSWFGLFYDGTTGDLWPCVNNTNNEATAATWNPQWLLANGTFSTTMPGTAPYNFPDAEFFFAGLNNQNGGGAGPVLLYGHSKYEEFVGSLPSGFEFASASSMEPVPIKNPSEHFQTVLDTGANILNSCINTFDHGLYMIKDRDNSSQFQFVDTIRGVSNCYQSPAAGAQTSYAAPSGSSVGWCWSAPEEFTPVSSNDQILRPNLSRRNVEAGFSMISYTPNGMTSGQWITTGLSQPAEFVFTKRLNATRDITCGSPYLIGGWNDAILLNKSLSGAAQPSYWDGKGAQVQEGQNAIWLMNSGNTGGNSDYIMYCWHSVPGYSAINKYVGNGSTDGPFCYTGFRPKWIMIRMIDSSGSWAIYDTERSTYNPTTLSLRTNEVTKEQNLSVISWDILSNGFKVRNNNGDYNSSGKSYLYIAFAEHPFGGSNVSPSPAR